MKSIERIHLVVVSVLAFAAQGAVAADCQPFIEGISVYERELKNAIHDEAEDLPKELARYERARQSRYSDQAERIENKIRAGYVGMRRLQPPANVAKLHADMVDYYKSGVAMLDAIERRDAEGRDAAEIATWVGLRQYFLNIRKLFVEHDCNSGDVEAIDTHYLPKLDETIDNLRREMVPASKGDPASLK